VEWSPYTSVKHPRLNGVFPPFGGIVEKFLDAAAQAGLIVDCFQGLRTIEQQDALYAQGRTKPGKVVTNAKGGQSYHNWGLACFDPDTEVLTQGGWKNVDGVKKMYPFEPIMVFKDGYIYYDHPQAFVCYDYHGDMIRVKTRGIDLFTTPNHKYVIKKITNKGESWGFTKADKLTWLDTLPTAGTFLGEGEINFPLKGKISAESWWSFMGWYLSAGSSCGGSDGVKCGHGGRYKVSIFQSQKSPYLDEIGKLLQTFPYHFRYDQGCHGFVIHSKELWEILFPLGDKYNRRAPRYLLDAPHNLLRLLWGSLIKGDGSLENKGKVESYYSVNKGLVDDVSELAVKLGKPHSIRSRTRSEGGFIKETGQVVKSDLLQWRLRTRESTEHQLRDVSSNSKELSSVTKEAYSGMVWCFQTAPGAFLVRRNGDISVCGNCDIVFKVNGQWSWDSKLPWGKLGALGVSLGLEWGGNWVKFPDLPHYQITYGTTIGNLYDTYLQAKASAAQAKVPFDYQALLRTVWGGLHT